jgi:hypothetical protein
MARTTRMRRKWTANSMEVRGEMLQEVLLLDLIGLAQGPVRSQVVQAILDRLGDISCKVYHLHSDFFQRAAAGELVTGGQIEGAIDQVERELANGLRRWREPLAGFLTVLLVAPETSSRLLVRIAEECGARSARLPLVLAARADQHQATIVEAARLPLKWRCLEGEDVLLACDVRMEGAGIPAFRRGTPLKLVERAPRGQSLAARDSFLTVAASEDQDAIRTLLVPWSLVRHPEEETAGSALSEHCSAVAVFRLPCWYEVQIEQTPEESG